LSIRRGETITQVSVDAETDLEAARGASLVLFCVKSRDTSATARALRPLLTSDCTILSLQNGVANPSMIAAEVDCAVVPTVVYVATGLVAPGVVEHLGGGALVMGPWATRPVARERLDSICDRFRSAGITVDVSDRVLDVMWGKLMANCAYNAISAITQLDYQTLTTGDDIRDLMRNVVAEVVAVGRAQGVQFTDDIETATWRIAQTMPRQRSSTAQDLDRGRPTEIDWINGQIVTDGRALGIPTPANHALWSLVRLLERSGQLAVPRTVAGRA
jgi:2-dehydropantoate 2-reductase